MAKSNKNDYFHFLRKLSILFLLVPPKNYILRQIFLILVTPHFCLLSLTPLFEFVKISIGGTGSFSMDMLIFGILMMHSMAVIRLLQYFKVNKHYGPIVRSIRTWSLNVHLFAYSSLTNITENKISMNVKRHPITKYKLEKMEEAKKLCIKMLCYLIFYVALNIFMTYTLNYQNPTYEKFNPKLNRTSIYRDYAYVLWYPFDTSVSDGFYFTGFFHQPYAFFFLMCGFLCVYMFGVGSAIYLRYKANVVGYVFKYIDQNIDETECHEDVIRLKEIRIVNCINELQDIYRCANHLNKVISNQMLFQMFFVGMILCSVVYRVEAVKSVGELFYLTSMVGVVLLICYFMCWFNQEFTLQVIDIVNRVQELDWVNYSTRLRKILIFMIARLQKPLHFTLGEWTPTNTGAIVVLVKTSYSFYTLIKNSGSNTRRIN